MAEGRRSKLGVTRWRKSRLVRKGIEQEIVVTVDTSKDRFFCEDAAIEDSSVVKTGLFEVGRVGESDICKSRPLRESGLA